MELNKLAEEIIEGRRLGKSDELQFFLSCDLNVLCQGADKIRQHFSGNKVDLCTIINGKSGRCSEDCKYCAQSAHHHTGCEEYAFLDEDVIVNAALEHEREGVDRFSIVTSGGCLEGKDFEKALAVYKRMKRECGIQLCASHGLLNAEQFLMLREAGVKRYHANLETSRRYFPYICTTHTYDQKIETIRLAQQADLSVCSGGIIGMGETWQDRVDLALTLSELRIESIPINVLMPIKGTAFQDLPQLSREDILRTVALFRYISPTANIRLAAGRALLHNNGEDAFCSGASAMITGNMLTTTGSTTASDRAMLTRLGRDIKY